MTESFSGFISIDDDETSPTIHDHKSIIQNSDDPRILIIKEYISKDPNASLKDIKTKALLHFSKASDEELKEIIKSATNIEKYNELYPQINVSIMSVNPKFSDEEIKFLEQHRNNYNRSEIYDKYKKLFPNSGRKLQFLYDYYYSHTIKQPIIKHVQNPVQPTSNHHILAQTIKSLYKAGFTTENIYTVKPLLKELLSQNSNYNEIELAIEFLKD